MKLIIDIPREYERDFIADKFKDFFSRVIADINCDGIDQPNFSNKSNKKYFFLWFLTDVLIP